MPTRALGKPHLSIFLVPVFAIILTLSASAWAQSPTGLQTDPNDRQVLISKDVGPERWAISLDPASATVTGNVFRTDGTPPQFVWCERTGDDGNFNPQTVEIKLACYGADPCAEAPCTPSGWSLINPDVRLPGSFFLPARDPFVPLRGPGAFCDRSAWDYEELGGEPSLAIDSRKCNYLTITQPGRTAVAAGSSLWLRLWHFSLTGSPANAHIALQIGNTLVWQAEIAIPAAGGLLTPTIPLPRAIAAGEPVYFHFQNHGENSYNLLDVRVGNERGTSLVLAQDWTLASAGLPALPPR